MMKGRETRVRIGVISVPAGRFDQARFRRLVKERLAKGEGDDRHAMRTTIADAARRASKGAGQ